MDINNWYYCVYSNIQKYVGKLYLNNILMKVLLFSNQSSHVCYLLRVVHADYMNS